MLKTALILLTGVIAVAFSSIFVRYAQDMPALVIATLRLVIAGVILVVWARMKGGNLAPWKGHFRLGMLSAFFLAMHFIGYISSLKYTSVASATVLVATLPIFVLLYDLLIRKAKQPPHVLAGVLLSVAGTACLAWADAGAGQSAMPNPVLGDLLALAGGFFACGYIVTGGIIRRHVDVMSYITVVYSMAAVMLLAVTLVAGFPFTGYNSTSYTAVLLLALVSQLVGHTVFNWALKRMRESVVSIVLLGEPVGAAILAFFLFGETVGVLQLTGFSIIISAIVLATLKGADKGVQ